MDTVPDNIRCALVRDLFPGQVLDSLRAIAATRPTGVYLVGGTVRDLLIDRRPADLDLTVCCHARAWARELARDCGGTFVELGREEDAARVVYRGESIDFSSFRAGAVNIDQELALRDLRINAMAVAIDPLLADRKCDPDAPLALIDPLGGREDLVQRRIRLCSHRAITDDPLRLIRVFRFAASLDFTVDQETLAEVRSHVDRIERVAVERVSHELELIMATPRAHGAFAEMAETGLLFAIMPELLPGVGMEQPASHHLDVFAHLLEALRQMECILAHPARFYPGRPEIQAWIKQDRHRRQLKWAAFLHDVGKPATYGINEDKGGRITFYYHDHKGADLVKEIGDRLRWPLEDTDRISHLVRLHMRPFFLANDQRQGRLTLKACLRLVREAGEALPALFLVAMADALAGKGTGSPEKMEQELVQLYDRLIRVWQERVAPVQSAQPLLNGHDLMDELGMQPGPLMGEILTRLQNARMEGRVATRSEALALAGRYLREAGVAEQHNRNHNPATPG